MLTFNEKYICAFNDQTKKHYITSVDIEPFTLTFTRLLYSYPFSCSSLGRERGMQGHELALGLGAGKRNFEDLIRVVNFKEIFERLGISIQLCMTKQLYLPQLDRYCYFQQLSDIANCVPLQYLESNVLIIKFTHAHIFMYSQPDLKQETHNQIENGHLEPGYLSEDIKERDRSRTIGEIIQHVKKWRHLAEEGLNGTKLNLQEAAAYVGIPKKSLDDYFYQLRVGEKYDFDFDQNLGKNISFLRKFVKSKVPSRHRSKAQSKAESNEKSEEQACGKMDCNKKLPKKLKQQQKADEVKVKQEEVENEQDKKARLSDSEVSSIQHIWPNPFLQKHNLFDEEDSFFNDFKFGNDNFVEFNHLLKNSENKTDLLHGE